MASKEYSAWLAEMRHARTKWPVRKNRFPALVTILISVTIATTSRQSASTQASFRPAVPAASAQTAYDIALRYMGFSYVRQSPPSMATTNTRVVNISDDKTPFIHARINEHAVWDVTFDSISAQLPSWHGTESEQKMKRSYHVLIDSSTGQLLRIYSRVGHFDPDLAPEPPAESAEAYMNQTREEFLGLPNYVPPIGFFQALNGAVGSHPHGAKEIEATLYLTKSKGDSVIPVWSIIGRGIPQEAIEYTRPNGPPYLFGRMRTIVNAISGKPRMITPAPGRIRDTLHERLCEENQSKK